MRSIEKVWPRLCWLVLLITIRNLQNLSTFREFSNDEYDFSLLLLLH